MSVKCECVRSVDLVVPGGTGELYTVGLRPAEGGELVWVRLKASSGVEAALRASYKAQEQTGVVGVAESVKLADRDYWVGLVNAYFGMPHECRLAVEEET